MDAQKSYFKFLMFVSLFHQLVAGPIVRYKDIAAEIERRSVDLSKFNYGINRFIIGLGKKVIIANSAGSLSSAYLDQSFRNLTVLGAWYGIFLFSIQIYFDFSGYSDMAIGLGRMFGFTYRENFNYPYIAKSATDFWRRWHISLGSFFRDYLYIPLGGNKHHHLRNILIVWMLTGLWHGSSWNFVLWGLFYGVLLLIEKSFPKKFAKIIPSLFGHMYLIIITLIGWTLFYFTDFQRMSVFMGVMFGLSGHPLFNKGLTIELVNSLNFIVLSVICSTPIIRNIIEKKFKNEIKINRIEKFSRPIINIIIVIVSISLLIGDTYNPFLYFRF